MFLATLLTSALFAILLSGMGQEANHIFYKLSFRKEFGHISSVTVDMDTGEFISRNDGDGNYYIRQNGRFMKGNPETVRALGGPGRVAYPLPNGGKGREMRSPASMAVMRSAQEIIDMGAAK